MCGLNLNHILVCIQAGRTTGDRLWRMPLFNQYRKQIDTPIADLSNIGTSNRMAGSCTAAAFLKVQYMHVLVCVYIQPKSF